MMTVVFLLALHYLFFKTTFLAFLVPDNSKYELLGVFPATDARPAVDLLRNKETGTCYYYAERIEDEKGFAEETPCPI